MKTPPILVLPHRHIKSGGETFEPTDAAQAIEEQGTITIRTYAEEEYVCIDIADDGAGMPPQVQQRIFDPFYTTKEVGKGTGLGLSMGYSIVVDKHGGQLLVESQEGEGTTFTIKIPLAAQ